MSDAIKLLELAIALKKEQAIRSVGPQGPIGPQGHDGLRGFQGEIGPVGPVGPQGVRGVDGPTGSIGPAGEQGIPGTPGDPGVQGQPGKDGNRGDRGERGTQGDKGPKGDRGAKGETGEAGKPGLVWKGPYSGTNRYQPGDVVAFNGSSYVANFETASRPTETIDWDLVAEKGVDGLNVFSGGSGEESGGGAELSDVAAQAVGTAAAGVSEEASRADHVHAHGNQLGGTLHAAVSGLASGFMTTAQKAALEQVTSDVAGLTSDVSDLTDLCVAASDSNAGFVSTGTQSFAGAKDFQGSLTTPTLTVSTILLPDVFNGAMIGSTTHPFVSINVSQYLDISGNARILFNSGNAYSGNASGAGTANYFGNITELTTPGSKIAAFYADNNTIKERAFVGMEGGIRANAGNITRPTADATHRGHIWFEQGGAGVADQLQVCLKDASDSYVWVTYTVV